MEFLVRIQDPNMKQNHPAVEINSFQTVKLAFIIWLMTHIWLQIWMTALPIWLGIVALRLLWGRPRPINFFGNDNQDPNPPGPGLPIVPIVPGTSPHEYLLDRQENIQELKLK